MQLWQRSWLYHCDDGINARITEYSRWGNAVRQYVWEILNQDGSLAVIRGRRLTGWVNAGPGQETAALAEVLNSAEHALASLLDWRSSGALV